MWIRNEFENLERFDGEGVKFILRSCLLTSRSRQVVGKICLRGSLNFEREKQFLEMKRFVILDPLKAGKFSFDRIRLNFLLIETVKKFDDIYVGFVCLAFIIDLSAFPFYTNGF